tara:strand:+ start:654 stop:950 length:297 start_codon:yes stop_codon:yes gene_type:complete
MSKFYPIQGKVAIRRSVQSESTSAGVIYTPKDNVHYAKGQVVSVGHPIPLSNGTVVIPQYDDGDWVIYKREGVEHTMGFDIMDHDVVVAIIEEDMEIS